jgi:cytochrome c5
MRPALLLSAFLAATISTTAVAAEKGLTGREIYRKQCARCHGGDGQGVAKVDAKPLKGNKSLAELTKLINDTMPEKKPELCVGDDAKKVARYIYNAFYSPQARKHGPARIELARLTVPQYLNSVADLLADGRGPVRVGKERGLNAEYYSSRQFRNNARVEKRIDPRVSFNWVKTSPHKKIIKAEEFSVRWQGTVIADESGEYEFSIKTELGARLWVNDNRKPLIDQWVASKGRAKAHTATIRLLGGRAYPIRLEIFKYKDPTGSISLEWKPPHKAHEVIPRRNLTPQGVPVTFVVSTPFPPDDRVSGYDRGVAISKEWDDATTSAAIETANAVLQRIDSAGGNRRGRGRRGRRFRRGGSNVNPADRKKRAMQYCRQLAERAFRRPLTDAQKSFFVDAHFAGTLPLESAVKRSVLLIMKSPRFLYPGLGPFDDYTVATRLALGLWDSVADRDLLEAAAKGQLKTPQQIATQANRMLADPRAKAKLRQVFHDWLMIDEKDGVTKDKNLYPGFDEQLASDLRTSLDLFIDSVVWSETSDYRQLLQSHDLFVNARLAKFYGVVTLPVPAPKPKAATKPDRDDFRRVTFEPGKRAGVLTHPYLLSIFAYHNLSSPIHRGVFLTRRVLGRTLKPPPQATEFKDGSFDPHMTTREKVALITKPTACMTCHGIINPLGFSLEHFDAVGRYREKEKKKPIDAVAVFETSAGQSVKLRGARGLSEMIAHSRQAHGAFVDHLFHQTVKQPINAYGPTTRDDLIKRFEANGFNIRKLLVDVMKTSITYERGKSEIRSTKSERNPNTQ